jgi:hypothetical protein
MDIALQAFAGSLKCYEADFHIVGQSHFRPASGVATADVRTMPLDER